MRESYKLSAEAQETLKRFIAEFQEMKEKEQENNGR